jgi:hypothetical protein
MTKKTYAPYAEAPHPPCYSPLGDWGYSRSEPTTFSGSCASSCFVSRNFRSE